MGGSTFLATVPNTSGRKARSRSLPIGPRAGGNPGPNGGASRELSVSG